MKWLYGLVFATLIFHLPAKAASEFLLNKEKSTLTFTATQNAAPIKGDFNVFDARIAFSPDNLTESYAEVTVDLTSVETEYSEVAKTLQAPIWFATATFPTATFKTTRITHVEGKQYRAEANLTIRDKTTPVVLDFTLTEFGKDHAVVDGKTVLMRRQFDVGQGEWVDTSIVKDEVEVQIHIVAIPAQ